ncbi:GNAT family N-acetyltransferase [Gallaecimonas mangrovi]|uniref:GNAT family N-acetyltransferase n=1 Tax=Gallaecimonas mangrovi TaxID=2291597 RepID=UPI000E1FF16C|nr:GNAT family N-acetyltransferase [Gallaecimonas mangrovi]
MPYWLRKATDADLTFLLALRDLTMKPYLLQLGMATSKDAYLRRIRYGFDSAQIVMVGDRPVGLFKARFEAADNHYQLIQIQLHPDMQNRQIASRLIMSLKDEARRKGAAIVLSVLKNNPAKALYARLGFVVLSDDEHEYVMQCQP